MHKLLNKNKIVKRKHITERDYEKIVEIKDQIDRKFVIDFYDLLKQSCLFPRISDTFAIFSEKELLKADDIYLINNKHVLKSFVKFPMDFKTEHLVYLKGMNLFWRDVIIDLVGRGAKLNQELVDFYCGRKLNSKFLDFLEHQDIKLSDENINAIVSNNYKKEDMMYKLLPRINETNVASFFRIFRLQKIKKHIKEVKLNVKCLENSCLIYNNLATVRKLTQDYRLEPNMTCLKYANSVNNYKVLEILLSFDFGEHEKHIDSIILNERLLRKREEAKIKVNINDVDGVESVGVEIVG